MIENKLLKVMEYFAPFYYHGKEDYSIKIFIDEDKYILLDSNKFYQALCSDTIAKKPYGLGIQSYKKRVWIQHLENKALRFWLTENNGGITDKEKYYDLKYSDELTFKDIKFVAAFYYKNNARNKELKQRTFYAEESYNVGKNNE